MSLEGGCVCGGGSIPSCLFSSTFCVCYFTRCPYPSSSVFLSFASFLCCPVYGPGGVCGWGARGPRAGGGGGALAGPLRDRTQGWGGLMPRGPEGNGEGGVVFAR